MSTMTPINEFMYGQRKIDLSEPYILLYESVTTKLNEYLQTLDSIEFNDGKYEAYCGEIKSLVNNFINYWTEIINECVKEADSLRNTANKQQLVHLVEKTISIQKLKQSKFRFWFSSPESEEAQQKCDEIEELFQLRMKDLNEILEQAKLFDKQETILEFMNTQFDLSIRKKNDFFSFAHTTIATQLANHTHRIKSSFEEILMRVRNNLKKLKTDHDTILGKLLDDLYDANKEKLQSSRQEKHRTTDVAESEWAIKKIREKIEGQGVDMAIIQLNEELCYWEHRQAEFLKIDTTLGKLRKELINVTEYQKQYESLRTTEYPGDKKKCWDTMEENFKKRKAHLQELYQETAKALMTFFAIKGQNRILYQDYIGKYAMDDYGHQIYVENYGKTNKHVKCDGSYVEYSDRGKYYFDKNGRYIFDESGQKLYQRAYCGSTYKLDDNDLFVKVTKDCGHSEVPNPHCKMELADPNLLQLLPTIEPIDIKKTLEPEVAKYLWDSVGYLLPEALCTTGKKNSRNPIYFLANKLMQLKYHKTNKTELENKKLEANSYRNAIFKERNEKDIVAYKEWKAKQVKRRKPEECDDTETQTNFHTYLTDLYAAAEVQDYYN